MLECFVILVLALWLLGRAGMRRECRRPGGLPAAIAALFGRVRTLPAGTEVLVAKRYHFRWDRLHEPMRVRVGWWNCRAFHEGKERYYFVERRSRYAVPLAAIT